MLHLWTLAVGWNFNKAVCVRPTGGGILMNHSSRVVSEKDNATFRIPKKLYPKSHWISSSQTIQLP
jgi:hypothetical protein